MKISQPQTVARPSATRNSKAAIRRARILELVEERDFISVKDLSNEFGLTEMSVRRDLLALEAEGLIDRVRGGATHPRLTQASPQYLAGAERNSSLKSKIARAAAEFLEPDSVVFFYSGSTVARITSYLSAELQATLTVVTNSLPIINQVNTWEDPHLVAVGGTYLPAYMAFVGPQAIRAFEELSADIAILGCDGLSAAGGLTTPHQLVAEIGTTIISRARKTIVVADSTKVGKWGFTPIAPIEAVDVLITDSAADPEEIATLRARGVEVLLV